MRSRLALFRGQPTPCPQFAAGVLVAMIVRDDKAVAPDRPGHDVQFDLQALARL